MRKRLTLAGLATLTALACGATHAQAAPSIVDELPIDSGRPYAPSPDGTTVWQTYATSGTTGVVSHLDAQTGSVIDTWNISFPGGYNPQAIGYANNERVYIAEPGRIISLAVDGPSGTTNPGVLSNDGETASRLSNNQIFMRVSPNGTANVALGQTNKVGILNLANLTDRWYPQSFYGASVASESSAFEACFVDSPGTFPAPCAGFGEGGPAAGQLDYPMDMTGGTDGSFYVTEYMGHTVTHVVPSIKGGTGSYVLSNFGSGPGDAAGQLWSPDSIRRIPDTGRLAISSIGSRRIDEFSPAGAYERSYGFGVLTGADEFETCGVGIGPCEAGVPYQNNSRSYFTQLDIVDGKLWAATELDDSIQVIDLAGGGGGGNSVDLKADPVKIKKGKKTTLTATLETCDDSEEISFQRKAGSSFENLGSALQANGACKAAKEVKINKDSTFQALALDSEGATIDTSPKVKVKLK